MGDLYGRGKKDDVSMEELLAEKARLFNKEKGKMGWYYFIFFLCQLLNVGMLVINGHSTDMLLSGSFALYGWDVANKYLGEKTDATPLCDAFPTVTTCVMENIGVAGAMERTSGLCILSQNIINQKIYFVLWWW